MSKLPSTVNNKLPILELKHKLNGDNLYKLTSIHVPEAYNNSFAKPWRNFIGNCIGIIHQLPMLFRNPALGNIDLKNIEAYFGRTSISPGTGASNLMGRMRAAKKRGHTHFILLGKCTIKRSVQFERFGHELLTGLKVHNGLCIANASRVAIGRVSKAENGKGVLYMSFALKQAQELAATKLTREMIDSEVERVIDDGSLKQPEGPSDFKYTLNKSNETTFVGVNHLSMVDL